MKLQPVEIISLAILFILSLGLFTFQLDRESLSLDEVTSYNVSSSFQNITDTFLKKDRNMWLYYIVLAFFVPLGNSEIIIRLPSAIIAAFGIVAMYFLGRQTQQTRQKKISTGIVASLLLMLNSFYLYYAQDARSYSLFTTLTIISTYFYFQISDNNKSRSLILFTLFSVLNVYSHVFAVVPFGIQLFLLVYKKAIPISKIALICGVYVLAIIPLPLLIYLSSAAEIAAGTKTLLTWVQKPGIDNFISIYLSFASASYTLLGIGIVCISTSIYLYRKYTTLQYHAVILLVTIPAMFLFSILVKPVFVERYYIYALPSFIILFTIGLCNLPIRKPYIHITIAVIVLLNLNTVRIFFNTLQKPDFRQITRYVHANTQSGDVIVFSPPYLEKIYRYYEVKLQYDYLPAIQSASINYQSGKISITGLQDMAKVSTDRYFLIIKNNNEDFSRREIDIIYKNYRRNELFKEAEYSVMLFY